MIAGVSLASPRALGYVIWVVLLLALWALHNLLDSREGRAIRALKGGRVMAESMGVDTARYRIKVFVLAALLAALSGWLYAHLQRFVNPTPFDLNIGIEYLFMAVVGGAGHLWGAVLGAALITLLKEQLQDLLPQAARLERQFRGHRVRPADAVRAAALRRRPVALAGALRRGASCEPRPCAAPQPRG